MSPLSLLLFALASVPTAPADGLTMPPPPAGMRELNSDDKRLMLGTPAEPEGEAAEDGGDNGSSEEVEAESAELEELRALEGASLDPAAKPNAEVLQTLRRLGLANPLRQRMLDVLEESTLREDDTPPPLPLITNLATFDVNTVRDRFDIPVDMQPLVAQYVEFFQGPGRRFFRKWVSRSSRYIPVMQPILEANGLPRDTVYLAMIESGFSAHAYSWAHASGPWQFISSTGKQYGLRQDFWVDERRDPIKATQAAASYLKDLHKDLGHWYLAWAGYNTGAGRVKRMMGRYDTRDFWVLATEPGLAKETKHYVPKLIAAALIAKNPEAFGFSQDEFAFEDTMAYEEVKLPDPTDLDVVARAAGVSVKVIQDLNPELKRWCTPPASDKKPYVLRVPPGSAAVFARNFPKIAPHERLTFRVHKVKRGDTLSQIAQKYGSAAEAILQMNQLKAKKALKLGTELVIPVPVHAGKGETVLASKVAQARRSGVVAPRPEEEIPAGTPKGPTAAGPMKTETIGGRTRVTYGVQDGDSLWLIADRFKVSVEDLQKWNNLSKRKRSTLSVGTVLEVWPAKATSHVEERGGTVVAHRETGGKRASTHTLASGETLWSVAQRYGVSVEDIMRWNKIKDHRSLPTGKQLQVAAP